MADEIDVTNWQMVSLKGDEIIVMRPKVQMSPEQALVQAAWLVSMAEITDTRLEGKFQQYLDAVNNS
jgi:hypothetical protein